jgi:Na+-driven multidrug efflux pump
MKISSIKKQKFDWVYHLLPRHLFQFVFMFIFATIIAADIIILDFISLKSIQNLEKNSIIALSYLFITMLPFGIISGYFSEQIIRIENISYLNDSLSKKIYRNMVIYLKFTTCNILVILSSIAIQNAVASLYTLVTDWNLSTFLAALIAPIGFFFFVPSLFITIFVASLIIALAYPLSRRLFYKPTR